MNQEPEGEAMKLVDCIEIFDGPHTYSYQLKVTVAIEFPKQNVHHFFCGWLLLYKAANDIIHNNTLSTFYSHSFQSLLVTCSTPK